MQVALASGRPQRHPGRKPKANWAELIAQATVHPLRLALEAGETYRQVHDGLHREARKQGVGLDTERTPDGLIVAVRARHTRG